MDYLAKRDLAQKELQDYLSASAKGVPQEIDKTRANVQSGRKSIMGSLEGQGVTPSARTQELDRRTESRLSKQKFDQKRYRDNLLFENLVEVAQQYGMEIQDAVAFARTVAAKTKSQEFAASEAVKDREAKERLSGIADTYAQRGADVAALYQPQDNYQAALNRVLFGTGTMLATGYGIKKYNQMKQKQKPTEDKLVTYGDTQFGPETPAGHYPQPRNNFQTNTTEYGGSESV